VGGCASERTHTHTHTETETDRQTERDRQTDTERERDRERERQGGCTCVRVCERQRLKHKTILLYIISTHGMLSDALDKQMNRADIVVSLLPSHMHVPIAKKCIAHATVCVCVCVCGVCACVRVCVYLFF